MMWNLMAYSVTLLLPYWRVRSHLDARQSNWNRSDSELPRGCSPREGSSWEESDVCNFGSVQGELEFKGSTAGTGHNCERLAIKVSCWVSNTSWCWTENSCWAMVMKSCVSMRARTQTRVSSVWVRHTIRERQERWWTQLRRWTQTMWMFQNV